MADETPYPDYDVQNEYTLSLNEKQYLLHVNIKGDYLIFICTPIEKKPQSYYIYKCTLNSLRKMSKAFQLYKNLTEVLYLFEELNKNKLISLEIADNDNYNNSDNESFSISNYKKNDNSYEFINLVIKLFVLVKEEVMIFPLEKKQIKENKKTINSLKNEINKISVDFNNIEIKYEKKIESLKKEVKLLRNENTTFKNQITELINKIEELKNILNKNSNKKNNINSIQDLINRVEKLEEWKNDASFTNKNINISINDSQQVKNENKINNKQDINNKIENNNNYKKYDKDDKDEKYIKDNKDEDEKSLSNENENNKEEDIIEEEEEEESQNENVKEKEIIYIDKKDNNSENSYVNEEEEEEEDDDEEEKEIINNNRTNFNLNIKYKDNLLKSLISQSNIIKNINEIEFVLNKIIKLNPISFTLLYKGTQDKDDSKIFHQKCDNIQNILLFILTDKNYIFGGYTSIGFDDSGNAKKDDDAFLFSVDFKKIYEIKGDSYAIFCNKNCGPIFCGKSDGLYNICIPDKYFRYKSSTTKKGTPFNTSEPFELNHGEKEFKVCELEVYRIETN